MKQLILSLAVTVFMGSAFTVGARDYLDHAHVKQLKDEGAIVPLGQLVADMQATLEARLVDAYLYRTKAGYMYVLDFVDPEKQVWVARYNAQTGSRTSLRQAETFTFTPE